MVYYKVERTQWFATTTMNMVYSITFYTVIFLFTVTGSQSEDMFHADIF